MNARITKWNHITPDGKLDMRFRGGKTRKERANGTHEARFKNRLKPIRRTSSHLDRENDNKPLSFWGG